VTDAVEGVTLEQYAKAAVAMHGASEDEIEERAQENGIPAGRLNAIAEEWNRRFTEDPSLVHRYSALYQEAMREAGITAPDITLEQYAEILQAQQRGESVTEVLTRFGLNLQTFALVSQGWIDRMAADPSIAMRLGQLLGQQQPPPGQPPLQPLL